MMYFPHLLVITFLLFQVLLSVLVVCLTPENIEELLNLHNHNRKVIASEQQEYTVSNMNRLEWSDRLSVVAAEIVNCRSARPRQLENVRNTFGHVNVGRRRQATGNLSQIVDSWFAERSRYLPDEGECFPWDSCNSFKNMINAKHRKMGCATVGGCGRSWSYIVLMCLYEGGATEQFQFQLGPPCSGLTHPLSFCQSSLGVNCNIATEQCDCRKSCVKPGIGLGQLFFSNCSCVCSYGDGPNCDQLCRNREDLADYNVCSLVSPSDCNDPEMGEHYQRFCAEVCSCRREPNNMTTIHTEQ